MCVEIDTEMREALNDTPGLNDKGRSKYIEIKKTEKGEDFVELFEHKGEHCIDTTEDSVLIAWLTGYFKKHYPEVFI